MTMLHWLYEKTPSDTDAPPPLPAAIAPRPDAPDDAELALLPPAEKYELEPVYTVIDYCDASGNETRRRITLRSLARGGAAPILTAVCHERRAVRHFRTDRIEAFIEDTGEASDCATFFREVLLIDLVELAASDGVEAQAEARRIRDKLRAPLSILVAVARSDERFLDAELDAIVQWLHDDAALLMDEPPTDMRGAAMPLRDIVRKMRPSREALRNYLFYMQTESRYDSARMHRFLRALVEVVAADGVYHADEAEMLNELGIILE